MIGTLHSFTPEILVDRSLENDKHMKKSVDIRHARRKWLMLAIYLDFAVLVLELADVIGQGVEKQLRMLWGHHDTGVNTCFWHSWEDSGEIDHEFGW